jgi:hypothetical protein
MAKQTINIGAAPNDGTGTPLRTSFDYTNQNFTELYNALGGGVGLPGATNQVIFNNGTNLAGDGGLIYSSATDALTAGSFNPTASAIPTNGIYLPSSKNIGIAVDGVNVLNIDGIASRVTTTGSATITGDLTVDTSTLKVDSVNNRVGVKTATPAAALHVASGNIRLDDGFQLEFGGSTNSVAGSNATNTVQIYTNNVERYNINSTGVSTWSVGGSTAMTLNSTGLGVGGSPTNKLTIGTGSFNGDTVSGSASLYATVAAGMVILADGLAVATRGGVNNFIADTSGNLISRLTTTAPTLSDNGYMVFNLTSNTNLRITVKCNDGTTRTANITLAP